MRLILKLAVGAVALLTIASAIIHPYGPVKGTPSGAPLLSGAEANSDVTRVLERFLRELPLRSHGVAVVQLCSPSIVDDRERRTQRP
jgi:hypothetical protein